ncbi:metallophosphoesterase family protein [Aureimonas pseudogalii]|uniref:Calcineurin-like phosphoesterase family protein n=1 Tax=Aureimonas pseudogalii TaxID=1744844 RepID=A0A7W6EA50_9HYPH|nr:metallophosphoesterase family protein [Aureimonas pseudogalii]MBB3997104.1 calcineurin-like phosphoesterase family protein [Aureimonas pseudogalii]
MIFFTSDTHFNDPRILRIDRRPFPDLARHDEALTAEWNRVVGEGDEVWHLGDFAKGTAASKRERLAALHGTKHLVIGNNDDAETEAAGWASVQSYAEITVDERRLVLCHYAFRTWNGMGKGALDLHGHSHARLKPMTRQHDVGVDAFPFRPVTLAEILASRTRGAGRTPADA